MYEDRVITILDILEGRWIITKLPAISPIRERNLLSRRDGGPAQNYFFAARGKMRNSVWNDGASCRLHVQYGRTISYVNPAPDSHNRVDLPIAEHVGSGGPNAAPDRFSANQC